MSGEVDRGRALVDDYWEGLIEADPLLGTLVGDERFDDRLPDPSEAGRSKRQAMHRRALRQLEAIDRNVADVGVRTSLDMLEAIALRDLAEIEHRLDRLRVVSHLWGPGQLFGELGSLQRADTPERLDRYLARLAAAPAFFQAVNDVVQEGIRAGVTAPRVVVERSVAQVERLMSAPPETSPTVMPVPESDAAGRDRVAGELRRTVLPALETYLEALRDYLPHATETIGLFALPGGDAMYAAEILSWTTLPLEAKRIHDLGLEDLEQIQEERVPAGDLLRERVRARESAALPPGDHHVPRGQPGPSLPDRHRAGDGRPAEHQALRRPPGRGGVRRRLGPVQRTPGRRDGPVPGRCGAPGHARRPGPPGGPADRRHRDPRVRMVQGAGHRAARGGRRPQRRRRDRDGQIHHASGAGSGLQDRAIRDRAAPSRGDRGRGRCLLTARIPRPTPGAGLSPAPRTSQGARETA